jgi:hypothetical protein
VSANLKLGAIGGWNDSFEKLDALLETALGGA